MTECRVPIVFALGFAVVVLSCAAGLRYYAVERADLWGDELLYLRMSHGGLSTGEVVHEHLRTYDYVGHLPSAALLTNFGLKVQGSITQHHISPLEARLPSVVAGFLTLLVLMGWIHLLHRDSLLTLCAMVVASLSFIHIYYSREAYYYPGQVLYAVCTLFFFSLFLCEKPRGAAGFWSMAGFVLSATALVFSHPTSAMLLGILGSLALLQVVVSDRRNVWLYGVTAFSGLLIAWVLIGFGSGQKEAASGTSRSWSLLFSETADLVEMFVLGPGLLRLLLSAAFLAIGCAWLYHHAPGAAKLFLIVTPIVFVLVQIAGRKFLFQPRYFLLVWPFVIWMMSGTIRWGLDRLALRFRLLGLVAVSVALIANLSFGLAKLYPIRIKRDGHATFAKTLDEELSPGTLCFWDGGHALRFIPDMYPADQLRLYGAMPAGSRETSATGWVEQALGQACDSFPLVAFLEWDDFSAVMASQGEGTVRERLIKQFGNHRVVDDGARRTFAWSGWMPDQVANFRSDYEEMQQAQLDKAALHLYYTHARDCVDPVLPQFNSAEWASVIAPNGFPLVLGKPEGTIRMVPSPNQSTSDKAVVEIIVTAFHPGTLYLTSPDDKTLRFTMKEAGVMQRGTVLISATSPQEIRAIFSCSAPPTDPMEPLYGLARLRSRPAETSD